MIKTLTLDGLMSVTIKQSAYDMARFCWLYNHSGSDIFASCVNSECTENVDNVLRIPAGEPRMLDTESYETLYLNGSGTVELITSAYSVCPFNRAAKGGGASLSGSASYTISNAVDYPLLGLNMYGKSTQDGVPSPDYPADIVSVGDSGSVTITVDNGDSISTTAAITSALPLCGIPVDSGGNYTDSNGQQWICDYVDFQRGVKVQRTSKITYSDSYKVQGISVLGNYARTSILIGPNNLATHNTKSICDIMPYLLSYSSDSLHHYAQDMFIWMFIPAAELSTQDMTGADEWLSIKRPTFIYELATPIETPLSETELQAYRKLQTYSGVTNVSNDGGADMDVKYCTDKSLSEYVMPVITNMQAQIDELKSAVLSLGGNV